MRNTPVAFTIFIKENFPVPFRKSTLQALLFGLPDTIIKQLYKNKFLVIRPKLVIFIYLMWNKDH